MSVKERLSGPSKVYPSRSESARYCPRYDDADRYLPYRNVAATLSIFPTVGGKGTCCHSCRAFRRNFLLDLTPGCELKA